MQYPLQEFLIRSCQRPREKLLKYGTTILTDSELIAIILRTGNRQENVLDLTKRIIKNHNIKQLSSLNINKLKEIKGIGEAKACELTAAFELTKRLKLTKERKNKADSPKTIAKRFIMELSNLKKEQLKGIYLNSRKEIIKEETISIGDLNNLIIHPREVFKIALEESAAAVILIHNHPSGNPKPSDEDEELTEQLANAGKMLGIELLDHIIIGANSYYSFKEKGKL